MEEKTLTVALRTNKRYFSKVYDDRPLLLYEPLLRWRPRKKGWVHVPATLADLEPRLAESYEVSPDGQVYTVHLRQGVKSMYGNELTAADIKWSWDRAFAVRGVGRFTGRIAPMRGQDNIAVRDKYAVEFRLDKPNVTFPHFLGSKYVLMFDSSEVRKHVTPEDPWAEKWLANHSAGFGPFFVESYNEKDDVVVFGAHKDYWCTGLPRIDRLIVRGIPSADERVRLLKSGEADVVLSLPVEQFLALQNDPDLDMMVVPSHDPMMLQMNCQREPFKNVKVRQAICYAMPYQYLFDNIWKVAARSYKSPFVDVCLGYTEEFFPYSSDIGKTKSLLSEAGLTGGFHVNMVICGEILPEMAPTGRAIQGALAEIGVNVDILDLNEQDFRTVCFAHNFDLLLDPRTHQVADAYYVCVDDYGDERRGIENMNQYYEPEVFRLQDECLKARSESERVPYVHEMQRVILQGAPQAYLFQINSLMGAGRRVRGLEWDVNGRVFYQHVYKA